MQKQNGPQGPGEMMHMLLSELGIGAIYCAMAGFRTSHLSVLSDDKGITDSQSYKGRPDTLPCSNLCAKVLMVN